MTVKTRVVVAGGKYLVTHPRSRITRVVVRFAVRKLSDKIATATHADAIPATRGSRLVTVVGVVVVAGGVVYVVRRSTRSEDAAPSVTVPAPNAPFPAAAPAAAPPESRDAPPLSPTVSLAAEAAAEELGGDDDDALAARVVARLFDGTPALGVEVAATAGVITLRGEVADEDAEGRFVRDAEQVEGVKAVQSELVTGEPGPTS